MPRQASAVGKGILERDVICPIIILKDKVFPDDVTKGSFPLDVTIFCMILDKYRYEAGSE